MIELSDRISCVFVATEDAPGEEAGIIIRQNGKGDAPASSIFLELTELSELLFLCEHIGFKRGENLPEAFAGTNLQRFRDFLLTTYFKTV